MAEMLYCGFYYIFHDHHKLSHIITGQLAYVIISLLANAPCGGMIITFLQNKKSVIMNGL
jgi:hypothetical protein